MFVRAFVRPRCLFDESCSAYTIRALRQHGYRAGRVYIQARVRSCRMPASACFVLDERGAARLLSATGREGLPIPPRALEMLARHAQHHVETIEAFTPCAYCGSRSPVAFMKCSSCGAARA